MEKKFRTFRLFIVVHNGNTNGTDCTGSEILRFRAKPDVPLRAILQSVIAMHCCNVVCKLHEGI